MVYTPVGMTHGSYDGVQLIEDVRLVFLYANQVYEVGS